VETTFIYILYIIGLYQHIPLFGNKIKPKYKIFSYTQHIFQYPLYNFKLAEQGVHVSLPSSSWL